MKQLLEAGLEEKNLKYFREKDPFNPQNEVEGYLSKGGRNYYGAIEIIKVNGRETDQEMILCTPKIDYPFNREAKYDFPSADQILSFEKYDGTNIYMYEYRDADYNCYRTFKIRQAPFLLDKFLTMWKEILIKYPGIETIPFNNVQVRGFAFELYGRRNKHMIRYEQDLDTALLFGRNYDGDIVPPNELRTPVERLAVPKAELRNEVSKDYVWNYEEEQKRHDAQNKEVKSETSDLEEYEGTEGTIWYLKEKDTGLWRMYKCKATVIQTIHFADNKISRNVIMQTAMNTLETDPAITYAGTIALLAEEFDAEAIDRSKDRIERIVFALTEESQLRETVRELLQDISADKTPQNVMRRIHSNFPKKAMRKVFGHVVFVLDEKKREQ